jgi:holo-[acyl-carrier protein] synthase
MIRGVGIDLVEIGRMERAIERWGQRFLERIFCPEEINLCLKRARPGSCFALRFAAKEAFAKALGLGISRGLVWRDIEVVRDDLGKPGLELRNRAQEFLGSVGAERTWLSLSDESAIAVAVVVLEG